MSRTFLDKYVGAPWWPDDHVILETYPNFDLAKERLPHRTRTAIRTRALRIGLTCKKQAPWLSWELDLLRDEPNNERLLFARLSRHTRRAILGKRSELGLAPRVCRAWKQPELSRLKELHAQGLNAHEIALHFKGESFRRIENAINRHCKPPVRLDHSDAIKAVLARASRLSITRLDLGRMIGAPRYFKGQNINGVARNVTMAIEALGGTFTIDWDEEREGG